MKKTVFFTVFLPLFVKTLIAEKNEEVIKAEEKEVDCGECFKFIPSINENCFVIRSKWLLVQNCSIESKKCSDRGVGTLAGRCIASTHFEYPFHNCSLGRKEIATHLCFSGFKDDKYKAKYVGGVPAADMCSYNHPLSCRRTDLDAYTNCFEQIKLNDFTAGIYEGLVADFSRIQDCKSSSRLIKGSLGLIVYSFVFILLFGR